MKETKQKILEIIYNKIITDSADFEAAGQMIYSIIFKIDDVYCIYNTHTDMDRMIVDSAVYQSFLDEYVSQNYVSYKDLLDNAVILDADTRSCMDSDYTLSPFFKIKEVVLDMDIETFEFFMKLQ